MGDGEYDTRSMHAPLLQSFFSPNDKKRFQMPPKFRSRSRSSFTFSPCHSFHIAGGRCFFLFGVRYEYTWGQVRCGFFHTLSCRSFSYPFLGVVTVPCPEIHLPSFSPMSFLPHRRWVGLRGFYLVLGNKYMEKLGEKGVLFAVVQHVVMWCGFVLPPLLSGDRNSRSFFLTMLFLPTPAGGRDSGSGV